MAPWRSSIQRCTPTLVLMGAAKRWAAFRQGTLLVSRVDKGRKEVELTYPPRLHAELVLHGFAESFRAAMLAAKADDPTFTLQELTEERARWAVSWS